MENKEEEKSVDADFANLPEVPLLKIFGYLRFDEFCKAGRVCCRWNTYRKRGSLWKSVDVHDIALSTTQIGKLISILPENTKRLKIYGFPFVLEIAPQPVAENRDEEIDEEIRILDRGLYRFRSTEKAPHYHVLQERCPHLHTLILDRIVLSNSEQFGVWNLPLNVAVLSVRRCHLEPFDFFQNLNDENSAGEYVSKIKILDCTRCVHFTDKNLLSFLENRLPLLQELYLAGCPISDVGVSRIADAVPDLKVLDIEMTNVTVYAFSTLNESCKLLEQLFISSSKIKDEELRKIERGSLRKLKVICLKGTRTSWESRRTLLSKLPSLQSINGFPCSRVLDEDLPNEYLVACEHFLLREEDFKI